MNKRKAFLAILFAAIMVTLPIASAYAAPVAQTVTPATCTVQSITPSADNTTVSVTCAEGNTLTLSAADALALSLVTKNADGSLTAVPVNGQVITPPAEVDPCAAPTTTSDTTGGTTTTTTTTTGDE
ncbi:MAG TPA: hypothetical protein VHM28_03310, partial [Anaerolineales bacterium]|nr:hypothetical protein [Anaerolineales bacterium]